MEKRKIEKLKTSDARKINLKKTDFFLNAKFASGLAVCYFLFKKFLYVTFFQQFQHYFLLSRAKTYVYSPVELNYAQGLSKLVG